VCLSVLNNSQEIDREMDEVSVLNDSQEMDDLMRGVFYL